ncbi:MAG TPA: cupin domain-containing protein [Candidatus Lustribacter sp.]|jgi:mannose-6-phosphate isomerase-like protein (cupin superfamily)|nr:cupin domain-containing protein [Candidatus Lustribacter sp.]
MRRVVTTHAPDGRAIVLSDEECPNVGTRSSGTRSTLMWTTGSMPATYAKDDRGAVKIPTGPLPGNTILRIVEFPPEPPGYTADNAAVLREMGIAPDSRGRRPPRHPHMHATESVDYAIVLEGEIDMLLDDSEVHLKAGDFLIQQGTNHAWVNRSEAPCKIAFVLIDATGAPLT